VPEYQNPVQLRSAGDRRRDSRGFTKPSKANEEAFGRAVEEVAAASRRLLHSLATTAPPKNREEVAAKAKARSIARFSD
jgi:hypothetical protein